jgi:aspartate/methionine/tyrosine aminotransferase
LPYRALAQGVGLGNAAVVFSGRSGSERQENAVSVAVQRLHGAGRVYLDLTGSNPTTVDLPFDDDAVRRALAGANTPRYEPLPFGMPSARLAVSELYRSRGIEQSVDQIALTASTSESYSFLFTLLADPGDEILVPSPSYPLFEYLARFSGLRPVPYPLRYDGAWHVDLDALGALISSRSRAFVVVNPNNPTGSFLSQEEWQWLAQRGLPLISDEVFSIYSLLDVKKPRSVLSALPDPPVAVFALDGLSKFAGLPQLKLGSIAFNAPSRVRDELTHRLELIADTFLSVSSPVQAALPALHALAADRNRLIGERIRANRVALDGEMGAGAATLLRAEGGWSAVLRLPQVKDEQAWVLSLLQEHGVLVQPGWFYDFADEPMVVISLLGEPNSLLRGARLLRAASDGCG